MWEADFAALAFFRAEGQTVCLLTVDLLLHCCNYLSCIGYKPLYIEMCSHHTHKYILFTFMWISELSCQDA